MNISANNGGAAGGNASMNFGGTNISMPDIASLLSSLQGIQAGGGNGRLNLTSMMQAPSYQMPQQIQQAMGGGRGGGGGGMMPGMIPGQPEAPPFRPGFDGAVNGLPNANQWGNAMGGMPYGTGGAQIQDWNTTGGAGGGYAPNYLGTPYQGLPLAGSTDWGKYADMPNARSNNQDFGNPNNGGAAGAAVPASGGTGYDQQGLDQLLGNPSIPSPYLPYNNHSLGPNSTDAQAAAAQGASDSPRFPYAYEPNPAYGQAEVVPTYYNAPMQMSQAYGQQSVLPPPGSSLAGSDWQNGGYSAGDLGQYAGDNGNWMWSGGGEDY